MAPGKTRGGSDVSSRAAALGAIRYRVSELTDLEPRLSARTSCLHHPRVAGLLEGWCNFLVGAVCGGAAGPSRSACTTLGSGFSRGWCNFLAGGGAGVVQGW